MKKRFHMMKSNNTIYAVNAPVIRKSGDRNEQQSSRFHVHRSESFETGHLLHSRKLVAMSKCPPSTSKDDKRQPNINLSNGFFQKQCKKNNFSPSCKIPSPFVGGCKPSPFWYEYSTSQRNEHFHSDQDKEENSNHDSVQNSMLKFNNFSRETSGHEEEQNDSRETNTYISFANKMNYTTAIEDHSSLGMEYQTNHAKKFVQDRNNIPRTKNINVANTKICTSKNTLKPNREQKMNIVIPTNKRPRYSHLDPGKSVMPGEHIDEPIIYCNDHRFFNSKLGKKKLKANLSLHPMLTDPPNSVINKSRY